MSRYMIPHISSVKYVYIYIIIYSIYIYIHPSPQEPEKIKGFTIWPVCKDIYGLPRFFWVSLVAQSRPRQLFPLAPNPQQFQNVKRIEASLPQTMQPGKLLNIVGKIVWLQSVDCIGVPVCRFYPRNPLRAGIQVIEGLIRKMPNHTPNASL